MRTPGSKFVAVGAIIAVVVVLGVVLSLGGHGSNYHSPKRFVFSQNLPTGTTYSNGQQDCGANATESLSVPPHVRVDYYLAVNLSGSSVKVWIFGGGSYGFVSSGSGGSGITYGTMGGGAAVEWKFAFQARGPGPTVPLGFWGYYQ